MEIRNARWILINCDLKIRTSKFLSLKIFPRLFFANSNLVVSNIGVQKTKRKRKTVLREITQSRLNALMRSNKGVRTFDHGESESSFKLEIIREDPPPFHQLVSQLPINYRFPLCPSSLTAIAINNRKEHSRQIRLLKRSLNPFLFL